MNPERLRELIRLVEESEIDELEIRRWGRTVRIAKRRSGEIAAADDGVIVQPTPKAARQEVERSTEGDDGEDAGAYHRVESPMVGTFYRAPAPEAPPFVEVGDTVRQGQTLCILEAMKLMNELESEVTGVVREVSVQNAEPVEYGQVLFRIAEDGAG